MPGRCARAAGLSAKDRVEAPEQDSCVYRRRESSVAVMQRADHGLGNDTTSRLDRILAKWPRSWMQATAGISLPAARFRFKPAADLIEVRSGSWLCENPSEGRPRARLIQTERGSRTKEAQRPQARFLCCPLATDSGPLTPTPVRLRNAISGTHLGKPAPQVSHAPLVIWGLSA